MGEKLTIGVVAKRLGLRPSAVRFYERDVHEELRAVRSRFRP
jgi:hypothetical protein